MKLGVFVGHLFHRFLSRLLLPVLALCASACSSGGEENDRMPWPAIPKEALGRWESPCVSFLKDSRYFEVWLKESAEFEAVEYRYYGNGCQGLAHDLRTRKGKVTELEELGAGAYRVKAEMRSPFAVGDLMNAEIIAKLQGNEILVKPISAELHKVSAGKTWKVDDPEAWILHHIHEYSSGE